MSEKKRVINATAFLFIASALTSVVSFVKESVFANFFGVSYEVDAYTISLQIPVILFAAVSVAIQSVVIPIYSDVYYNQGKEQANSFSSNFIGFLFLATGLFTITTIAFADYIIYLFAPGFDDAAHVLSVKLIRIALPIVVFTSLIDVSRGILNIHKSFV
ncbi:MAG: hypothetical protein L6407_01230, partial [Candidatus Delongbacteria bacterium]|nr:hypothetical protein [Candidatus Delongbacteria bacterium]